MTRQPNFRASQCPDDRNCVRRNEFWCKRPADGGRRNETGCRADDGGRRNEFLRCTACGPAFFGHNPAIGRPGVITEKIPPRRAYSLTGRALLIVPVLALLFGLLSTAAGAQTIHLPPVTRTRLANGVRLVIMEYHRAPTITVRVSFAGGERLDPEGKTGATSLMAELMKRGTETRTAPQIAEAIDFLGGSLEVGADDERVSAGLDILAKDADTGLDLMADVLRHPTFPAEEIERSRSLELSALKSIGEDPGRVASFVLTGTMYAGHPYGREATITSVQAITRDDILAAYGASISTSHMIVVAVGDFKAADMAAKLKARFGDWPTTGSPPAPAPPVVATKLRRILVDKPDATQTQVRLARIGFPRTHPDYYAAQLADTILGGGFTSRLVDEIRVNKSLTYGISSAFPTQKAGGLFEVQTFTKLETTRALLDNVRIVMAKTAQGGVTPAEFQKARGYLAGQYAVHVQTPEALAGELAAMAFYSLPDDYLETYLPRLRAVALPEVNRIARTYFAPGALSTVLVGPAAKIASQLRGLGDFETVPIEKVAK